MPDTKTYRFELIARYYDEADPPDAPPRWEAPMVYRGMPYAAVVGIQGTLLGALQTFQAWGEAKAGGGQPQFTAGKPAAPGGKP